MTILKSKKSRLVWQQIRPGLVRHWSCNNIKTIIVTESQNDLGRKWLLNVISFYLFPTPLPWAGPLPLDWAAGCAIKITIKGRKILFVGINNLLLPRLLPDFLCWPLRHPKACEDEGGLLEGSTKLQLGSCKVADEKQRQCVGNAH